MVKILALTDHLIGSANQTLALAEVLDPNFIRIKLSYNKWSKLPNFIRRSSLIGVNRNFLTCINNKNIPDMIISCGRRIAPVACYLKKIYRQAKTVHILNPGMKFSNFDVVILPYHDQTFFKAHNIIRIDGAISNITPTKLLKQSAIWYKKLDLNKDKYVALLIGGNTKFGQFTKSDAQNLITNANKLAFLNNAKLLITTSRRTGHDVIEIIKQYITVPYHLFNFNHHGINPYLGYLSLASAIIVTGDSMSMCSDACSSGKPVFIYSNGNFMSKKHHIFCNKLYRDDYAFNLDHHALSKISNLKYNKLDNIKDLKKLLLKNYHN